MTADGPSGETGRPADDAAGHRLRAALRAMAPRIEAARRLSPGGGTAVLRSIVETTAVLFGAEAASIALHDPATDRLVFEVAAGEHGESVVGIAIGSGEGVAGYVFSTGQPIALSDVASDARFGRSAAERTGYVPRSLVAVPLADDEGVLGVLEVLDKRGDGGFDLRDVELASVFARQATVAIRSSRIERDAAALLRSVLAAAGDEGAGGDPADIEAIVADAVAGLDDADADPLWALADQLASLRAADAGQLDLVRELLAVLVRRAEGQRADGRGRSGWSR